MLTDRGMNDFLVWNDNKGLASAAPYVFGADGKLLDRLPTNLASVPDGLLPEGSNAYSWDDQTRGDSRSQSLPVGHSPRLSGRPGLPSIPSAHAALLRG